MGGKRLNQNHHSDGKGDQPATNDEQPLKRMRNDAGAGSVEDEGVDQNAIDNIVIGKGDGGLQIAPASAIEQQTAPAPTAGDSLQPGGSGVFDAGIAQLSPAGGHNNQQEALDLPEIAPEDLEAMVEADAAALAAEGDDEIDVQIAALLAGPPAPRSAASVMASGFRRFDLGSTSPQDAQVSAPWSGHYQHQQQQHEVEMDPASPVVSAMPEESDIPPALSPVQEDVQPVVNFHNLTVILPPAGVSEMQAAQQQIFEGRQQVIDGTNKTLLANKGSVLANRAAALANVDYHNAQLVAIAGQEEAQKGAQKILDGERMAYAASNNLPLPLSSAPTGVQLTQFEHSVLYHPSYAEPAVEIEEEGNQEEKKEEDEHVNADESEEEE